MPLEDQTDPFLSPLELDDEDDGYPYLDEDDPDDDLEPQCGMTIDGLCTLVGTEYCEFDCPFRDMEIEELL